MPSGFSAQHFAKGATINDSSPSTSTTYSSSKIDQKIASGGGGGGGSTTFLALTDTPASFSANQTVRANAAGNALEFYTPSAGVSTFLGLTDTPASFSANQTVRANAAGNALEFYTPSAGASTFLALTDTPASFTNGKLLYSTASGVELTTTQIAIDGGNIEVDQVNARQNDTTNIGDSSHRFNTVHCLALHQGTGKIVLPSLAGTAGQLLKIQSVNPSGDMLLQFAGLSFTPSFTKSTMYGKVDRTSIITVLQGSSTMFDGQFGNQGGSTANVAFYFNNSAQHCINEFTIYTQKSATGATSDPFRANVCEIYGSTGTDTSAPPSGNWQRLNDGATVWLAEAIATPFLMWEQYSQAYPQGFRFKCTTNMNNYNRYWLKFNFTLNPCYDVHWNYNKSHEAEYT
jgi:hypothetical protein